jgi:lycopene beta-cyclase
MSDGRTHEYDVVLVGGGLACGLAALALRRRWPRLRLGLCESGQSLGGNHTWSFFASDVDPDGAALLDPMVVQRWASVEVAFPDHRRQLRSPYASITSTSFDRVVQPALAAPGSALHLGRRAQRVTAHEVVLDDGQRLRAPLVLDGRGPGPAPHWVENQGFQKFVGLEVEVEVDAAPANPVPPLDRSRALLMDATVAQHDGFRFIYVLPLSPTRLLVEDTYYADGPAIDAGLLRARLLAYLGQRGLRVVRQIREESGVLGLPWVDDTLPPLGSPLRLGARGGWFHPTTGYSLPLAVQVAQILAAHGPALALPALGTLYQRVQQQARFSRRLNRLLFRAAAPDDRWRILSRFYRLPQPCIERFYRLASTRWDHARILLGRPPAGVSLRAAFAALQTV